MASRARRDLTQGSIFGHLMRMVIPMSLGIAAMMAVGVIDAYWLGRLGTAQQAAVQLVFPVSMAVMSLAIGLGAGAVSVVSRAAGKGDQERTRRVATDAIILSFLVVAVTSLAGIALIDPLFRAMGATEAMMDHVRDYMLIWFAGNAFIVGPMIASNILRALGDAILPSVLMMLAAFFNILLAPVLIFGWGPVPALGVQGAALSTLIANFVVFLVSMAILIWREKLIDLSWPGWSEILWNWREIARIGAPAAGSNMINPMSMSIVFAVMARFGEDAVAGFGVASRVEAFAIIPLFALSACLGPITGQNGAAGLADRVRAAFRSAFMFCVFWGVGVAALLALLAGPLAAVFLPSEAARETARLYWYLVPVTVAGYGAAMAASAGLNGLGRALYGAGLNVARGFVFVVPLAVIGGLMAGATGAIIGLAAANVLTFILAWVYVMRLVPLSAVQMRARPVAPAPPPETAP